MTVNIYIETKFHGKFSSGEGRYSIVLEAEKDNKIIGTRKHFGVWTNTTPYRLQLKAVIEALCYINTLSVITIYLDNNYIESGYHRTNELRSNKKLWSILKSTASKHAVLIKSTKHNKYSSSIRKELMSIETTPKKDEENSK